MEIILLTSQTKHFLHSSNFKSLIIDSNITVCTTKINIFPGNEIEVRIAKIADESIMCFELIPRINKITIFHSFGENVNNDLMEIMLLLNIFDRISKKDPLKFDCINLKISYLGYSRQDKDLSNTSFGAKVVLDILSLYSNIIDSIFCFDTHFDEQNNIINNCYSRPKIKIIKPSFIYQYIIDNFDPDSTCLILPDAGSFNRLKNTLNTLSAFETIILEKYRDNRFVSIKSPGIQFSKQKYLILDDMISSGSTVSKVCEKIKNNHIMLTQKSNPEFILICTHMLWFAIMPTNLSKISKIVTTNSIEFDVNKIKNEISIHNPKIGFEVIDIFKDLFYV